MNPGLYVHIPFCDSKCPYCSFAVAVSPASDAVFLRREAEYLAALEAEAGFWSGQPVATLYIGGGTPSMLSVDGIERLFQMVRRSFILPSGAEVTFEMNPESVDSRKADVLKQAAVTRVSLGIQSLDDGRLRVLGRTHTAREAREAFSVLRSSGFDNINVDLMFGFPGQTREEADAVLASVLELQSEHLSLYALNIEHKSLLFSRRERVDDDVQASMYGEICRRAREAGFVQYEVSNFARPGFESRHNMSCWRGGEYIGIGMAAHSHKNGRRFWNADTLPRYLDAIREGRSACSGEESLTLSEKLMERFLFGLRMNEGVDLDSLERTMGLELPMDKKEMLESFIELGLLEESGACVRATDKGRLLLDEISARLV